MQFQDLDPTKKLPYIRSNNTKIAILLSIVFLLVVINVFVILYGKSMRNSPQNEPVPVFENNDVVLPLVESTPVQIQDKGAETTLIIFFEHLKTGKIDEAKELISEYSSEERFEFLINEGISYGKTIGFKILGTTFSSQGNYAYITVEFMSNNVIQYQKYTLIKIHSVWKLLSVEIL